VGRDVFSGRVTDFVSRYLAGSPRSLAGRAFPGREDVLPAEPNFGENVVRRTTPEIIEERTFSVARRNM
jgi:hypothetical protein